MSEIVIRQVHKSYAKNKVVHGVDLLVKNGEFVVILGPSGCGKSTLLRMVAGLEEITAGDIAIGGKVVNKLEPRERGCAMVFQNYALYPHMTVGENIGYALKVAGLARRERDARVKAVADALGLSEFLSRKPGQLSGGQRQRVAMGRAMIREPQVFLYDEPLSNLDARLRVSMRVEIRKLHHRLGATTLFVTHDQIEAMTLADRIVVMNKGVIEQVGAPREVYNRPQSAYVAGFIGTPGMNIIRGVADSHNGVVMLPDGQAIAYDKKRWPEVKNGEVLAGFRAEKTRIADGEAGLTSSFQFSEEMGASRLLHLGLAGHLIVAASVEPLHLPGGASLQVGVRPGDVHLFDAASGKRLGGEVAPAEPEADPLASLAA